MTQKKGCDLDTNNDGDCPRHPNGCPIVAPVMKDRLSDKRVYGKCVHGNNMAGCAECRREWLNRNLDNPYAAILKNQWDAEDISDLWDDDKTPAEIIAHQAAEINQLKDTCVQHAQIQRDLHAEIDRLKAEVERLSQSPNIDERRDIYLSGAIEAEKHYKAKNQAAEIDRLKQEVERLEDENGKLSSDNHGWEDRAKAFEKESEQHHAENQALKARLAAHRAFINKATPFILDATKGCEPESDAAQLDAELQNILNMSTDTAATHNAEQQRLGAEKERERILTLLEKWGYKTDHIVKTLETLKEEE